MENEKNIIATYCSKCEQDDVVPTGNFQATANPATGIQIEIDEYICRNCGQTYWK